MWHGVESFVLCVQNVFSSNENVLRFECDGCSHPVHREEYDEKKNKRKESASRSKNVSNRFRMCMSLSLSQCLYVLVYVCVSISPTFGATIICCRIVFVLVSVTVLPCVHPLHASSFTEKRSASNWICLSKSRINIHRAFVFFGNVKVFNVFYAFFLCRRSMSCEIFIGPIDAIVCVYYTSICMCVCVCLFAKREKPLMMLGFGVCVSFFLSLGRAKIFKSSEKCVRNHRKRTNISI